MTTEWIENQHRLGTRSSGCAILLWFAIKPLPCINNFIQVLVMVLQFPGPVGTTSYWLIHIDWSTSENQWYPLMYTSFITVNHIWFQTEPLLLISQTHSNPVSREMVIGWLLDIGHSWESVFKTMQLEYVRYLNLEPLTVDTVIFLVMYQPLSYALHDFTLCNKWCSIIVVISIFLTAS